MSPQCWEMVSEPPGFWHRHQCTNKAKVRLQHVTTYDAKPIYREVCGVHAKGLLKRGWHRVENNKKGTG